ncbi:putative nuclease with TOPRIM domain [Paenibacillus sp. SORGH_AS306]|uniref:hypothetical protein n=1 Tax=unclassified Paenibacillus TaxID=185978 RepID=UPI00278A2DE9|nr:MULTISPECIES: hypothetical protein [unclassified Paenibacillus]MDQ1233358.1 putative nuclease with TOPRIM domain [Paenibacillus sp. SORGH_AS_0306]MDR6110399.1 putative nuclease with TOPRIM domain [Paenibacillus sp. SORGH_AS_0338]
MTLPEGDVITIEQIRQQQEENMRQMQSLSSEFARLAAQTLADEARFNLIEQNQKRHDEEIHELKDGARQNKMQYEQVMTKFDTLELKLFNWLQQLQQDSAKERISNNQQWFKFLSYVLGGTIIAIVTAVFIKGGL